jgi:hypothetical protein
VNSECTVEGDQASIYYYSAYASYLSPDQKVWSIPVTFNANFSGTQTICVYVASRAGFSTGYQALGTVTIP